jgi:hypothetical protein
LLILADFGKFFSHKFSHKRLPRGKKLPRGYQNADRIEIIPGEEER